MSTDDITNGAGAKRSIPDSSNRKEFWLSSFSINNRISVLVLIMLVAVLGIVSYITIPKESFPNITVPNIFVVTIYPGVSPEDMESLITRKLEDELSNISDVKTMTSTSSEGYSNINLEFNTGIDIDEALQKVREKVDLAKPELPEDAEDPTIQEVNLSEFPIMQVNLSGDYSLDILKEIAEDLQEDIEAVPSVLGVDLTGGLEREVQVDVDLPKMKYYNLSFTDIIAAIQQENVTVPGGDITVGTKNFLLRVPGQYETTAPLEDIVVNADDDKPVYIRDVATVTFGYKERETYSTLDGSPVITLGIKKRTGQNILDTSTEVKSILEEALPNLPPSTVYKITNDQSKDVVSMVSNLENNIISGLILVVGVLLFFLGVRNASFVGVSIPLSMFLSFIILSALGITMNMIVLFSLILALGMLVDNAIVVVENIYRYLEEGFDNFEAAKKGTGEVALPIITGTTTTIAAFAPMIFWPGIVGEFMGYLPKTLIITLGSSLFVGLIINPVICALFMRVDTEQGKAVMTKKGKRILYGFLGVIGVALVVSSFVTWTMLIILGVILWATNKYFLEPIGNWWQLKGLNKVLDKYEDTLEWALNHRLSTIGISVAVLISSFVVFGVFFPGSEFFPEDIPPRDIYVQIETPVGSDVEFTKSVVDKVAARVEQMPYNVDYNTILATSGAAITSDPAASGGNSTHLGTVAINFVDYEERQKGVFEAMEYMRNDLSGLVAGAKITVEKPQDGPPTGPPINLEISGPQMDQLTRISNRVLEIMEEDSIFAKLDGLETDLPEARPEVKVEVDREKAALFDLNTNEVGMTVRQAINGVEASKFRDGKEEYEIIVRLSDEYRDDLSTLADLTIFQEGIQVPLSEVATWEVSDGFGGIRHKESERVITVSADVRSGYQSNAVLAEAQVLLQDYLDGLPGGYSYEWTGQQQDQQESFEFLGKAFLIALFLIAFILVSQFNSVAKPVIILSSVIMSTAGVFYGLVTFQMALGLMAILGIISLAGVVVNNAIVLIDYVDILRTRDGLDLRSALIEGGKVRFRPVILTAITTTLGLVPLAIGFNFDFITLVSSPITFFSNLSEYIFWGGEQAAWWGPMAIAVIVGLIFATALTLILVPVLYSVIERGRRKVNTIMFGTTEPGIIKDQSELNGESKGKPALEPSAG
ncbi:MAG: efflux RND transporter permease subunit [Gracilimonas sp.]|uniref:efflux RND transporter permease subunit n=1 Tax=Gracilimonas TaxID=649462 RepID=UPI001B2EEA85|nr:efflux RND transporter permease subunit [Gracilimonas sp.]MBO6585160.1 efflux RND transporter permease subunit [Gracilimonas sp.]MBO6615568.1 efflux RND transporter permease subunit [Gracilimonas sp.]